MKKIAIVISAVTIAVASTAASAWGWGNNGYNGNNNGNGYGDGAGEFDGDFGFSMNMSGRGNGRGNGNGYNGYNGQNGYGYAPYGYAPYGYGAPVAPAVEMTEDQKKAVADQQAQGQWPMTGLAQFRHGFTTHPNRLFQTDVRDTLLGTRNDGGVPVVSPDLRQFRRPAPLFEGIPDGSHFYFAHSYFVSPDTAALTAATTDYEGAFTSVASVGPVYGVQFHPEKSAVVGERMLANFARLAGVTATC